MQKQEIRGVRRRAGFLAETLEERRLLSAMIPIFAEDADGDQQYQIGMLAADARVPSVFNLSNVIHNNQDIEHSVFTLGSSFRPLMNDVNGMQFRFIQIITSSTAAAVNFAWNGVSLAKLLYTGAVVDVPSGGWDYEKANGGSDTLPFYEANGSFSEPSNYGAVHSQSAGTISITDVPKFGLDGFFTGQEIDFDTFLVYYDPSLSGSQVINVLAGYQWQLTSKTFGNLDEEASVAGTFSNADLQSSGVMVQLQSALNNSGFSGWTVTASDAIIPGGTFSIPTDGSENSLPGLIPGQTISVEVQFSTTDENEDGEGEYLTIATSGGDSMTDTSYNATSVYTFTATSAQETVSATPIGWDGDESAVVSASFSFLSSSFTPAQTSAFSTTSADLNTAATGTATVANTFASDLESGRASYDLGAENAAWATAALQSEAAADFTSLSVDPVDSDYKVIVRPTKTTSAILSEAKSFKGIKTAGALTASINALDVNEERSVNLAAAAYATANKLDGAIAAGDTVWTKRQTATLKSYKKQLAALLAAQPLLATRETTQLNKAGLGSTTVASTDVNNFEDTVNDDGLPSQLVTDLTALGVSSATQSQIQQALFAQDIDTASGSYSSILTNASLLAELKQVATLLKAG